MWKKLKQHIWEWRGVWIAAPTVTGIVLTVRLLGGLQFWEWAALDYYFRTRPQEPRDDRIVIVGINEADLRKRRQWPLSDDVLVQLLEKVKAQNPRVIGLDLYRDLPVEPGHAALVKVFETTPNLIGIEKINEDDSADAVAPSPVLSNLGQVGINNLVVDADGKLRRGMLSMEKQGQLIPSFAMLVAGMYLQAHNIEPQPTATNPEIFQWGKSIFRPFRSNDGGYIGADDGGYQFLLNYRGPAETFRTVSLTDVLENRIPTDLMRDASGAAFAGRIVLIGSTATSLNDFFYTPYSGEHITTRQRTTGVEIHANLISHILSAAIEGRPGIQTWSDPVEGVWILFWSFIGATLIWKWRYTGGVNALSLWRVAISVLATSALLGSTYVAFLWGWWIPVVPSFLVLLGSAIAITAYMARTAAQIRKTFGRYLNDSVVVTLLENPKGLKIGGESRKITVLTSDLRGFTSFSERLQPQEVVKALNIYLEHMTEVILQYEGTIDEFLGDGILVVFGAPTAKDDDSARAVACAVAMQLAMASVNEKMMQLGFPSLEMGIGISTGVVVVGNIGSEKRCKYSAIGRDVNLAFRIESYTVGGQIFISESTLNEVEPIIQIDGYKEVQPKGVKHPIIIYNVKGIAGDYNLFLCNEEEIFFPIPEEICLQFHYTLLDGKHVSDSLFTGSLVKLSAKGAEVRSDCIGGHAVPEPLSNIKLNLLTPNNAAETSEDIYAKVLEKQAGNGSFYIHFTAKPPDVDAKLNALYERARAILGAVNDG
jgi:adenylate cyclase